MSDTTIKTYADPIGTVGCQCECCRMARQHVSEVVAELQRRIRELEIASGRLIPMAGHA